MLIIDRSHSLTDGLKIDMSCRDAFILDNNIARRMSTNHRVRLLKLESLGVCASPMDFNAQRSRHTGCVLQHFYELVVHCRRKLDAF
ncbi:MAG: hypothetical protein L3K26_19475, partial [Candidatus Hydrogenedentes bacterium]|nr:hypothetical protein [Candidatus Hydrogenedentota bacterium]